MKNLISNLILFSGILILLGGGCAKWKNDTQEQSQLPMIRTSNETIPIEVLVLKVSKTEKALVERLFKEADHTRIPMETRKSYDDNGMRISVVSSGESQALEKLVEIDRQRRTQERTAAESLAETTTVHNRMRVRPSQTFEVLITPVIPSMSWVVNEEGYLRGGEVPQAQCQAVIRARLNNDGSAALNVLPEIRYGTPKQRIDVGNNSLVYKTSRDKVPFELLRIKADLNTGESIVLGPGTSISGLGENFFQDADENDLSKIVLIRFGEMNLDAAFIPEQNDAPIITSTD